MLKMQTHQKANTGKEQSKKKISYVRYMLLKKIPIRFGMILVSEISLSFLLYILPTIGVLRFLPRPIFYGIVLLGFWVLNWNLAKKNRHRTHEIKHYYICNIASYALFLTVALLPYFLIDSSMLFSNQSLYYFFFRLSYIVGILNDGKITKGERPVSMLVFYGVTFAVIMLEPLYAAIRHRIKRKQRNRFQKQ